MYEPNTEPLVRVEDVSVHFPVRGGLPFGKKKQVKAVDHISLCIPKRETFGLVGESGCGKSTLANAILGMVRPTGGKIFFRGEELTALSPKELRRAREEARKAAEQAGLEAARAEQTSGSKKKRRRKKKNAEPSDPVTLRPSAPGVEAEDAFDPLPSSASKRAARPGALMDTGDAMPDTDFYRSNPLDSDVIMDATARLLAPRRSLLSGILPKGTEKPQKQEKKKQPDSQTARVKKVRAEDGKPARPGKVRQQTKSEKQTAAKARPKKAEPAPQPSRGKGASRSQRRDRRMPPEPPRKNQPKDSTEQASLMKPYYLDIDR